MGKNKGAKGRRSQRGPLVVHAEDLLATTDLMASAGATMPKLQTAPSGMFRAVTTLESVPVTSAPHDHPMTAVIALAQKVVSRHVCACGRPIELIGSSEDSEACRWRIREFEWVGRCGATRRTVAWK